MLRKILGQLFDGVAAGLLITIGCCVFLPLSGSENTKWVGAVLFSVALLTICYKNYSLYTGRIGLLLENLNKDYISGLLLGLLGNVIATAIIGIAVQYAMPNLHVIANVMCQTKLLQEWWQTLIRAILCGVLMYVAVSIFKQKKSIVGVLFAIPVFILSGFEHSIADMGYFAIGGIYSAEAFGFIWIVIIGNSIGALILPVLGLVKKQVASKKGEPETAEQTDANVDLNVSAEKEITPADTDNFVGVIEETEVKDVIPTYTADTSTLVSEESNE